MAALDFNARNGLVVNGSIIQVNALANSISFSVNSYSITTNTTTQNVATVNTGTSNVGNLSIANLSITNFGTLNIQASAAITINVAGLSINSTVANLQGTFIANNSQVGINAAPGSQSLIVSANDGIWMPSGNSEQRPASANIGYFRYNTDYSQFEWVTIDGNWTSNFGPTGAGRFTMISGNGAGFSSSVALQQCNGSIIIIGGIPYTIPPGGINGNLTGVEIDGILAECAANTLYYAYVAATPDGLLYFDMSTTGHQTSTVPGNIGTEIKIGNNARTLVGMFYCPLAGITCDAFDVTVGQDRLHSIYPPAGRYVASWHNRRLRFIINPLASGFTSTANTWTDATNHGPLGFVSWGDGVSWLTGWGYVNFVSSIMDTYITLDGLAGAYAIGSSSALTENPQAIGTYSIGCVAGGEGISEGKHYFGVIIYSTPNNIGTMNGSQYGMFYI